MQPIHLIMTGSRNANLLAASYAKHLTAACNLRPFFEYELVNTKLPFRILRRLVPNAGFGATNRELLELVRQHRPDSVWLFNGKSILPSTIRKIREMGVLTVNYNPDHPWEHFSRGSGNANIIGALEYYDVHFTYSLRIASQLRDRFPSYTVEILPFGHDVDKKTYTEISSDPTEINRICFIGNPDKKRTEVIQSLLDASIPVDVFGYQWERFLGDHSKLCVHPHVTGFDMYQMIRRYRAQLNILRPHNLGSHNMRTFEIPACGGIMLAEHSIEHQEFFSEGQEVFLYRSMDELVEKARSLLNRSDTEAQQIRTAARNRSEESGYSYGDRAASAIQFIQSELAQRNVLDG